jgi:hypothetical protein
VTGWAGAVRVVLLAVLLAAVAALLPQPAQAAPRPQAARIARPPQAAQITAPAAGSATPRRVVVIGISGLRWSDVSASATPTLWRLAGQGSVGSLVDYAVLPLTCPADGWLTLNSGARAQADHTSAGCGPFPAVAASGNGATVPGMAALESYNERFSYDPRWGLLAGAAPGCATAVGPGAALALADRAGRVASYLPSPAGLSAGALSRCPLTVVDLGSLGYAERASALRSMDAELAHIMAELPARTTVLLTAPGAVTTPPHLQVALVSGPGYRAGLLDASSTRQPGLVVLTDLTPTVLGWLGSPVPSGVVGAQIARGQRGGSLTAAVGSLAGRDVAEQVWRSTHDAFFWAYALADAVVLAVIGLACRGAAPPRRRRRARGWRVAGVFAASVPVGTFLADLAPWWRLAHPAAWLYGVAVSLAAAIGGAALLATRRWGSEDPLAPFGVVCLFTLAVLAVDLITGSRLQLETPFGLSVLEAGRFYGIGNEALGIYGIAALFGAAWLGMVALRRHPSSRRPALCAVAAVAVVALFASGWPSFGDKVGGTIAMVPCFILLAMAVAGVRLTWRRLVLALASGLALFAVFALISYFVPATGASDIGRFAGDVLHGHAGAVLLRKTRSNIGSLSVSAFSPVIPIAVVASGLMLWRPAWFRLRSAALAFAARPLLRTAMGLLWLMLVLGWLADDSGVIVPASALPFALPLVFAVLAAVADADGGVLSASEREAQLAAARQP